MVADEPGRRYRTGRKPMPQLAEQFIKPDLDARLRSIESMLAIILDLMIEDDDEPQEDLDGNAIPMTQTL
jgi:hypothetical protein